MRWRSKSVSALSLVMGLLLTPSPAVAQPSGCGETSDTIPRGRELLVVELPAGHAGGSLDVEYVVDGVPAFAESIQFAPAVDPEDEEDRRLVELLAWHPSQADDLLARSNDGAMIFVELRFDGEDLATRSLAELRAAAPLLLDSGVRLRRHHSRVEGAGRPANLGVIGLGETGTTYRVAASYTCEEICELEFDDCRDNCGGDTSCELWCQDQYVDCWNRCSPNCPTTRDYTVTQILGDTQFYPPTSRCLDDIVYAGLARLYYKYERDLKRTTYRETTACDGSQTTQVIGVAYVTDVCWKRISVSCSSPDPYSHLYCRYQ